MAKYKLGLGKITFILVVCLMWLGLSLFGYYVIHPYVGYGTMAIFPMVLLMVIIGIDD